MNDRSAAKQSAEIPVSMLVIGGKWSSETTSECEFFIPWGITLSESIRRPLPQYFGFPERRFPFKTNQDGAEHHKLVSYANV